MTWIVDDREGEEVAVLQYLADTKIRRLHGDVVEVLVHEVLDHLVEEKEDEE